MNVQFEDQRRRKVQYYLLMFLRLHRKENVIKRFPIFNALKSPAFNR